MKTLVMLVILLELTGCQTQPYSFKDFEQGSKYQYQYPARSGQ